MRNFIKRRQIMSKQDHHLSSTEEKELRELFKLTQLHSPNGNGNSHFGHFTGLEFQQPLPANAEQRFADLKRQLEQKKTQFMTVDAQKGLFIMHCPGHPCVNA
jgi:hypothetical protein